MRPHDTVLDRLDRLGRDVGHHEPIAEIAGEGLEPHEVDLELVEPHVGRDVHRGERLGADHAVLDQAMTRLEMLDAGIDVGIEDRRGAGGAIEIA